MPAGAGRHSGIDLLRVVAGALLLVAHSAFWLAPLQWPTALWQGIAYLGVEAFLVSYGFLLTLAALRQSSASALLHGMVRRLLRLWPVYALAVLLNLAFVDLLNLSPPSLGGYLSLSQNLFWPHPPFFPEAWIVAAALAGAVVVAIACVGLQRIASLRGSLLWIVALIVLTQLPRMYALTTSDPSWDLGVRKIIALRLDPVLYGVLIAVLWQRGVLARVRLAQALAVVGVAMLAVAAWTIAAGNLDHSVFARSGLFITSDIGFALLLPTLLHLRVSPVIASVAAALASSAYMGLLSHMSLLRLGLAIGAPMSADTVAKGLALQAAYLLLAIVIAWLLWRWLDRPLRRWLGVPATQQAQPVTER